MIGYLRGQLIGHDPQGSADQIILLVGGVGYQITCSVGVVNVALEQEIGIWIHSITREDGTRLFGFADRASIQGFVQLLDVSGVGAKVGIALISAHGWQGLSQHILAGNVAALTQADGVGKKIAERIVHETASKLAKTLGVSGGVTHSGTSLGYVTGAQQASDQAQQSNPSANFQVGDVVSALVNLGYGLPVAQSAAQQALLQVKNLQLEDAQQEVSISDLITLALRHLSHG